MRDFTRFSGLKWTKSNIESFGGDPDNVTIFGESAGGRCVEALLCSPSAEGLFHKAMCQSGNSFFTIKTFIKIFSERDTVKTLNKAHSNGNL